MPGNVIDGSDGTIACDSYNQYYTDIKILEQMGVKSYRFSISWARILPQGILTICLTFPYVSSLQVLERSTKRVFSTTETS